LLDKALRELILARAETGGVERAAVVGDQRVDAGAVEHVRELRGREEGRQWHADHSRVKRGEIPQRPVDAVIERDRDAAAADAAQSLRAHRDFP